MRGDVSTPTAVGIANNGERRSLADIIEMQSRRGHVLVRAPRGGVAQTLAPQILANAEKLVDALLDILAQDPPAGKPLVTLGVVEPVGALEPTDSGATLVVVLDGAQAPLPVEPIAARVVARLFGADASLDRPLVQGLAGVAAARAKLGAPVADCESWARARLEAGKEVSAISASASPEAATAFAAHLLATFGPADIAKFLAGFDPERRDQAAVAAFQEPLAVVHDAWLGSLRRRAGGENDLGAFLRRVYPLLRPFRKQQAELFALLVAAAATNVITPIATKRLMADLTSRTKDSARGKTLAHTDPASFFHNTILPFLVILAAAYILGALVSLRRSYAVDKFNRQVSNMLQEKLYAHLQRLSHNFHNNAKIGDLMARLNGDVDNVQKAMSQISNKGLYNLFTLVAGVIALFFIAQFKWQLCLPVLLIAPFFALPNLMLRSRNKAASKEQRKRSAQISSLIEENLTAHEVVKAFGMEQRAIDAYSARLHSQMSSGLRLTLLEGVAEINADLITAAAQLVIFGAGAYLVLQNPRQRPDGFLIGDIAATLMLLKYIYSPVASLVGIGQNLQQASGSLDRVNELFDAPVRIADRPGAGLLAPLSREIEFDHVTFGYGGSRPVLKDLCLRIPAGSNVSFVGPSGSGKSTTVRLILRFYDPDGPGRVLIDGNDIRDVRIASLRGQMGIVLQETSIFDSTLRDNITLGRPDASEEQVQRAVRSAQLDGLVSDLPDGLDTVLGERGSKLSGGQKQRIGIARAFLKDPRILILDEATSALDAQTEAEILETLASLAKGRTTISITHRLSWAAKSDLIYVLDKGELVEQGGHAALLAAGGLYRKLYEEQTGYIGAGAAAEPSLTVARLGSVPLFAGLPKELVSLIAARMRVERAVAGGDVIVQGQTGDRLYLIASGELEVTVKGGVARDERVVARLREGDYFGEIALVAHTPRTATVRAVSPATLYTLSSTDFTALMNTDPRIRNTVLRTVEERRTALGAVIGKSGVAEGRIAVSTVGA